MKNTKAAATVDDYMAGLEPTVRNTMEKMRKMIRQAAPKAEEKISYMMPAFIQHGPVAFYSAFKNHCSYYTASHAIMKMYKEDLKDYYTSGVTIHFPLDKPLPAALVKKLVYAKLMENEARFAAKQASKPAKKAATAKPAAVKTKTAKLTGDDEVTEFMNRLEHPFKAEIEALRRIIKGTNKQIHERIKWNAPSYYHKATPDAAGTDFLTFHVKAKEHVHLIFHHAAIAKIKSPLLEGDYKDRRMVYFKNMNAVKANKKELERIVNELVKQFK